MKGLSKGRYDETFAGEDDADADSTHVKPCISTYRIGEQRWFWRVCACAQARQSLRCSHTQRMDVDEVPYQNLDL